MPTEAMHFRRLVITQSQKDKMMIEVRKRAFNIVTKSGYFIQPPEAEHQFPIRLVHSKLVATKALVIDENRDDHLEFEKRQWQVESATDMIFDFGAQLVSVLGPKGGFKTLIAALEEMDINSSIEELKVDLKEFYDEYIQTYKKTMVKSVGVKNYIADHGMKTSGTFKASKDSDSAEFINDNADDINKISIQSEYNGEKFKVTLTDSGSVSINGDAPASIADFIGALMSKHNLVEVATVAEDTTEDAAEDDASEEHAERPSLVLVPTPPPLPAPLPQPIAVG